MTSSAVSSGAELSSTGALVEVTGVEKRFGTTRALRGVDLSIDAGQCLGLVGRNGAGKSTLVSILSGLSEPDAGTVRFGGEPAPRVGDIGRWREWIATVFQHSMIVPDLSVAENVFLGAAVGDGSSVVSWRAMRRRTRDIMGEWGLDIAPETPCRELSVEQLQIVEIARALARGARCVLLDEPTAALERQAVTAAVRPGTAAHRGRRRRPLHLAPPGRGLRDLPGRRRAARRRAGADRAHRQPRQGRPGRGDGRRGRHRRRPQAAVAVGGHRGVGRRHQRRAARPCRG